MSEPYDLGEPQEAETKWGKMMVYPNDHVGGRHLHGEHYEEGMIDFIIESVRPDPRTIIDVGANIGTHTVAYLRAFPTATVVAIEPHPLALRLLRINAGSATILPLGAGAKEDTMWLNPAPSSNLGGARLYDVFEVIGYISIPIVTIDSIGLSGVDLIKIDVEGMEWHVIRGAMETIKRDRPVVAWEYNEDPLPARLFLHDLKYEQVVQLDLNFCLAIP